MADVAHTIETEIDSLLDALELEWRAGLSTVAVWDELSELEQMAFIEEWAIPRDYYAALQAYAEQGDMSEEQQHRFVALERFIHEHRDVIERALEGPGV